MINNNWRNGGSNFLPLYVFSSKEYGYICRNNSYDIEPKILSEPV